jgi:Rieske Fe-S protein
MTTNMARRNINVIKTIVESRMRSYPKESFAKIEKGEGKIVEIEGGKRAVYKDENGGIFDHSPYCTHMGCVVSWNNAEKTWDCPCHGSRFDVSGEVIHPPAVEPL